MKLRARLILAFFLLAVVPLAAIVTYGYHSSITAFRAAVQAEAMTTARQLTGRLAEIRGGLDAVLGRLSSERFPQLLAADGTLVDDARLLERVHSELGAISPLIEACEYVPVGVAVAGAGGELEVSPPRERPEPPEPPAPPVPEEPSTTLHSDEPGAADEGDGEDEEQGFVYIFRVASATQEMVDTTPDSDLMMIGGGVAEAGRVITMVEAQEGEEDPELGKTGAEARRLAREQMLLEVKNARAEAVAVARERVAAEVRRRAGELLPEKLRWDREHREAVRQRQRELETMLGHSFSYPVRSGDQVVGRLSAEVRAQDLLSTVLKKVSREEGQIPFAIDCEGQLHAADPQDEEVLAIIPHLMEPAVGEQGDESWIVVKTPDETSGMTFGIVRPVGEGLHEIRRTAVRNLMWGLLLVGLAGLCVLPMSNRLTRNLRQLSGAADTLAAGDLTVRVPVHSDDEVGQLAGAFNHMAAELEQHQEQLLEHELQHRLLEVENRRKSRELEDARELQLSLLPRRLPEGRYADIAVAMHTATEVGGDYYDFAEGDEDSLVVTIGDATGHGAAAGTMVTIAKSLFTAGDATEPRRFLQSAATAIRRMRPGRMCMAMQVLYLRDGQATVSSAGMPPLLVHRRRTGAVEEVLLSGVPLGAMQGASYDERGVPVEEGDTLLLMSDGFPELADADGEPLGYERAREQFAAVAELSPQEIISGLESAARRWRDPRPQNDDITFVVLRIRNERG